MGAAAAYVDEGKLLVQPWSLLMPAIYCLTEGLCSIYLLIMMYSCRLGMPTAYEGFQLLSSPEFLIEGP